MDLKEVYMTKIKLLQKTNRNSENLPLEDLRRLWAAAWEMVPHARIGQAMLEKSLAFKMREARGDSLSAEQRERLDQLVTAYKRNPKFFDEGLSELKPGMRLVKSYKGEHHSVLVHANGFEYRDKHYGSLSEIASAISGTRWNGWVFFGLKKSGASS